MVNAESAIKAEDQGKNRKHNIRRQVILAAPRGFCAGVDRAIEIVERALEIYGSPLYVKHEIVHNKHVVESFQKKGVRFVEELKEVPHGQTVVFSAHGVSPAVWEEAKANNLNVIDATCPLVTKVHLEARRYAKEGKHIILIGHKKHVETQGTYGEAPEKMTIVETEEDVAKLSFDPDEPLAFLTQTTLSIQDTQGIIEALRRKFPQIESPAKSDICYATTNRQKAISELSENADMVLVLGSANSSNSNRLREIAANAGVPAYLIDNAEEINPDWIHDSIRVIGVTAGASAPEKLVREVIERLKAEFSADGVTEKVSVTENVSFQLPKKLKEQLE